MNKEDNNILETVRGLKNDLGERLDFTIEGNLKSKRIILFAHGFGTDKHERGLADDMSAKLIKSDNEIATLRFSFSGYGKSEGKQQEKNLKTMAMDLKSIYKLLPKEGCKIDMVGFSMGCFVIAKVYKLDFNKAILVNLPGVDVTELKDYLKNNYTVGVNKSGTWRVPRSDGSVTLIGKDFWDYLNPKSLHKSVKNLMGKHIVSVLKAKEDHAVIEGDYDDIPIENIVWVEGDHNFSSKERRDKFLDVLSETYFGTKDANNDVF